MSDSNAESDDRPEIVSLRLRQLYEACRNILGVALICFVLWIAYRAHDEHGIVVEALSVSDSAKSIGYSGQVIASRMVDRMAAIAAGSYLPEEKGDIAAQPPDVPVKVQLSGVGVSIEEIYGYLRSALGATRNVTGEVVDHAGKVTLRLRAEGEDAVCEASGPLANLDKLITSCTDTIYQSIEPARYARFVALRNAKTHGFGNSDDNRRRIDDRIEAETIFRNTIANAARSIESRAWSYDGLGMRLISESDDASYDAQCAMLGPHVHDYYKTNPPLSAPGFCETSLAPQLYNPDHSKYSYRQLLHLSSDKLREAIDVFAQSAALLNAAQTQTHLIEATIALQWAATEDYDEGENYDAVYRLDNLLDLHDSTVRASNPADLIRRSFYYRAVLDQFAGDYVHAISMWAEAKNNSSGLYASDAGERLRVARAMDHDEVALMNDDDHKNVDDKGPHLSVPVRLGLEQLTTAHTGCDGKDKSFDNCMKDDFWRSAFDFASVNCPGSIYSDDRPLAGRARNLDCVPQRVYWAARQNISTTSTECDPCLRMRARIDALGGQWAGANYWFGRAAAHAPSVSDGYSDWARALLQEFESLGKRDVSRQDIKRRLRSVVAQGIAVASHDPNLYEVLGELYFADGRPAAAVSKLGAALSYAPKWGRAHRLCYLAAARVQSFVARWWDRNMVCSR